MTPFVAAMAIERSDFEIALEEGTIRCAAKVGGRSLVDRGAFVDERVGLQVAHSEERGRETLGGERCGTFHGRSAKRGFSVRVR